MQKMPLMGGMGSFGPQYNNTNNIGGQQYNNNVGWMGGRMGSFGAQPNNGGVGGGGLGRVSSLLSFEPIGVGMSSGLGGRTSSFGGQPIITVVGGSSAPVGAVVVGGRSSSMYSRPLSTSRSSSMHHRPSSVVVVVAPSRSSSIYRSSSRCSSRSRRPSYVGGSSGLPLYGSGARMTREQYEAFKLDAADGVIDGKYFGQPIVSSRAAALALDAADGVIDGKVFGRPIVRPTHY